VKEKVHNNQIKAKGGNGGNGIRNRRQECDCYRPGCTSIER
jgi:hypothetical protein